MFKRMFNAAKDLQEKRPEPVAAEELDTGVGMDKTELFAGMSFAQEVLPEEAEEAQHPAISPNDSKVQADENLFSGLSMVSEPLAEAASSYTDQKSNKSSTPAPSLNHPKGNLMPESSPLQGGIGAGETKAPSLQSMTTSEVLSTSKLPPVLVTGVSAGGSAALRPAVVRKKKRSMRVGYAREGESEGGMLPGQVGPNDGTPYSQSPRSSIGDTSELQLRGREEEGGVLENPREAGTEESDARGEERGEAPSEANARSQKWETKAEVGSGPKNMEEVQREGLIAMVPSAKQQTEATAGEMDEAKQAANHIEQEREAAEGEGAGGEVETDRQAEESGGDSREGKIVIPSDREMEMESEPQEKEVAGNVPEPTEPDAAALPTAASLEKATEEVAAETTERGTEKGALQRLETDLDIERIALEEQLQEEEPPTVESLEGLPLPEQVAQVRQFVEKRLAIVREKVAAEVAKKKAAVQRKREAADRAAAAGAKLAELEEQVTEACDQEDFEKADELTKEIEGIEKEVAAARVAVRGAEAEGDSASVQVRAIAQEEIDAELQGAALLRAVTAAAHAHALRAKQSAEAAASEQEASLQQQEDEVAERRRKVGLELRVIEEENAALRKRIDESTLEEVKQKEDLVLVKSRIERELEELRVAVREKERELAEQEAKVAGVDEKIAVVASKYGRELKGLQADEERVSAQAAELEAELERVAEERRRVAASVEAAASARKDLEETTARAELDAAEMEGRAKRKQGAAAAAVASQKRREELTGEEMRVRDEAEAIRERVGALRASFQEVAVVKLRLQQELAAEQNKVEGADKRAPELEAEKKLAAQARNFKEAARLSSEAKALAGEREKAEAEVGRLRKELGAAEEDERTRAGQMAELETELTAKEKEAATARCERLRLVAAAARQEMDEAAEAEDFEEAGSLQAEAEAADAEAEQLKGTHGLVGPQFEVVEHVEGKIEDDVSKEGENDVSRKGEDGIDRKSGDDASKHSQAEVDKNNGEGRKDFNAKDEGEVTKWEEDPVIGEGGSEVEGQVQGEQDEGSERVVGGSKEEGGEKGSHAAVRDLSKESGQNGANAIESSETAHKPATC